MGECIKESFDGSCIGMYCGRVNLSNSTNECFSSCQSCPTGYRVDNGSVCQLCDSPAVLRDYLYFLFMCLVVLFMRFTVTTIANWKHLISPWMIPLFVIPVIEALVSVLLTLLSLPPRGSLHLNSCAVHSISDFYPIFFNPSSNYVNHVHCTYEVVYPLYSMVFIFFGFSFIIHTPLLLVVLIVSRVPSVIERGLKWSRNTEYLWLIAYPILLALHGVLAGVIYYSFDYLTIIIPLGSFAVLSTLLLSIKEGSFKNPFKVFTFPLQWLLIVGTMVFLSCGILSLTEWDTVSYRALFLPLVLLLPLLHPVVTLFASPAFQFDSWGVEKITDEFYFY